MCGTGTAVGPNVDRARAASGSALGAGRVDSWLRSSAGRAGAVASSGFAVSSAGFVGASGARDDGEGRAAGGVDGGADAGPAPPGAPAPRGDVGSRVGEGAGCGRVASSTPVPLPAGGAARPSVDGRSVEGRSVEGRSSGRSGRGLAGAPAPAPPRCCCSDGRTGGPGTRPGPGRGSVRGGSRRGCSRWGGSLRGSLGTPDPPGSSRDGDPPSGGSRRGGSERDGSVRSLDAGGASRFSRLDSGCGRVGSGGERRGAEGGASWSKSELPS